jgi:hypothetical protein
MATFLKGPKTMSKNAKTLFSAQIPESSMKSKTSPFLTLIFCRKSFKNTKNHPFLLRHSPQTQSPVTPTGKRYPPKTPKTDWVATGYEPPTQFQQTGGGGYYPPDELG